MLMSRTRIANAHLNVYHHDGIANAHLYMSHHNGIVNAHVYVCNVINYYYYYRALQLPPSAWLNLAAYNASVTWLQIAPNGRVCLLSFGDTGFIPPEKITYWLGNY